MKGTSIDLPLKVTSVCGRDGRQQASLARKSGQDELPHMEAGADEAAEPHDERHRA
jgi:hypothetical protein